MSNNSPLKHAKFLSINDSNHNAQIRQEPKVDNIRPTKKLDADINKLLTGGNQNMKPIGIPPPNL